MLAGKEPVRDGVDRVSTAQLKAKLNEFDQGKMFRHLKKGEFGRADE